MTSRSAGRVTATWSRRASSSRAAFVGGRAVRDEPGLGAGDHDDRPLATLGGVERQQLDAGPVDAVGERIGDGQPRPQGGAVAEGLVAQEVEDGRGDPSFGGLVAVGLDAGPPPSSTSWAQAAQAARRRQRRRGAGRGGERRAGGELVPANGDAGVVERRARGGAAGCWSGRARRPLRRARRRDRTSARGRRRARPRAPRRRRRDPHRRPVTARRRCRPLLSVGPQHLDPGGDDLRRAPVVDRQRDDLDAGEAIATSSSSPGSAPLKP